MSYSNREKLMNYVQTPPQNDNYVALIILSSTVLSRCVVLGIGHTIAQTKPRRASILLRLTSSTC